MNSTPRYSIPAIPFLLLLILLTSAFVALTFAVRGTLYFPIDLEVARAFQAVQIPGLFALMQIVGWFGYPPQVNVEMALIFLGLWFVHRRWEAVSFAFATLGIAVVGVMFKLAVDRPRPTPDLIRVLNPALDGGHQSYPAGHVQVYIATLGILLFMLWARPLHKPWQTVLMILLGAMILLIGPSRIYVGEHWFSDVIGAIFLGLTWLLLSIRLYEWGRGRVLVSKPRSLRPGAEGQNTASLTSR